MSRPQESEAGSLNSPESSSNGQDVAALLSWLIFFGTACFSVFSVWSLPGDVDLRKYSSGIFDADVDRVVRIITSFHSDGLRLSVHPLFQILLTPIASALGPLGLPEFRTAQLVCCLGVAIQLTLLILIVRLSCPGFRPGIPLAGAIFLSSFSVRLMSVMPESCAWSGVSALLPLWFCLVRREKPFSCGECVGWALLLPLSIGYTVTQVSFWFLAVTFRGWFSFSRFGTKGLKVALGLISVSLLVGSALVVGLAEWQHSINPSAPVFYRANIVSGERLYSRPLAVTSLNTSSVLSVARQMFVNPFAAPVPGYSALFQSFGYFSLSLEEAKQAAQPWFLLPLQAALAALLAVVCLTLRRLGAVGLLLFLGVFGQFGLHIFYGREFILYSLNWIAPLVALSVLGASGCKPLWRTAWVWSVSVLLPVVLAWNYSVLGTVLSEVSHGLEMARRDASGAPLL